MNLKTELGKTFDYKWYNYDQHDNVSRSELIKVDTVKEWDLYVTFSDRNG